MRDWIAIAAAAALGTALLAGCKDLKGPPKPEPVSTAKVASPVDQKMPDAASLDPAATEPASDLDIDALQEREDPAKLLQFYANAVEAERWEAAAAAWSSDADVTAETLIANYGGSGTRLAIGKGDMDSAAGTQYYEAPVTVQAGDGHDAFSGTIVLRRINDMPGASEEQLSWRIERSSLVTKR